MKKVYLILIGIGIVLLAYHLTPHYSIFVTGQTVYRVNTITGKTEVYSYSDQRFWPITHTNSSGMTFEQSLQQ